MHFQLSSTMKISREQRFWDTWLSTWIWCATGDFHIQPHLPLYSLWLPGTASRFHRRLQLPCQPQVVPAIWGRRIANRPDHRGSRAPTISVGAPGHCPPALHVPSSLPPVPAPVSVHVPQPAALFVFVAGLPHRCHRRNYYPFACPLPHPLSCLHLSPLLCLSQAAALPPLERLSLAGPCEWHLGRPQP